METVRVTHQRTFSFGRTNVTLIISAVCLMALVVVTREGGGGAASPSASPVRTMVRSANARGVPSTEINTPTSVAVTTLVRASLESARRDRR